MSWTEAQIRAKALHDEVEAEIKRIQSSDENEFPHNDWVKMHQRRQRRLLRIRVGLVVACLLFCTILSFFAVDSAYVRCDPECQFQMTALLGMAFGLVPMCIILTIAVLVTIQDWYCITHEFHEELDRRRETWKSSDYARSPLKMVRTILDNPLKAADLLCYMDLMFPDVERNIYLYSLTNRYTVFANDLELPSPLNVNQPLESLSPLIEEQWETQWKAMVFGERLAFELEFKNPLDIKTAFVFFSDYLQDDFLPQKGGAPKTDLYAKALMDGVFSGHETA